MVGGQANRARLADVAEAAGVSKSIASRVLNGDGRVSVREETRQRILDAAERLAYRAHVAARLLRHARAGVVGLLTPDLTNPVIGRIVRAAVGRARALDHALLLYEDTDGAEAAATVGELCAGGRIDGLIVVSARPGHPLLEQLAESNLPHVFVNRAVPGSSRNVTMADERASAVVVDHLAGLGHRRLGHVAGPASLDPARRRIDGFLARAAELGLEALVAEGDFSPAGGRAATAALLDRPDPPTALYASSITQAPAVLRAAHERGMRVPSDLSVCTYDESPLAAQLVPALTTVAMPLDALAVAAVDALAEQLAGGPPRDVTVPDEPSLIVRESTGPPGPRSGHLTGADSVTTA